MARLQLVPRSFVSILQTEEGVRENASHYWTKHNESLPLFTESTPQQFIVGTGNDVYSKTLIPAIVAAEHEVLFITCFWASSPSLSQLSKALLSLSRKALRRSDGSKIRVRLYFSSRSLLQKLFHSSSHEGYVYAPSGWSSKLSIPPPEQLKGLDLQVKSKFFRPFSVMHPKLVIVDRMRAFLPSCNLSWEDWFECCISIDGEIVAKLLEFCNHFWEERLGLPDHPLRRTDTRPPPIGPSHVVGLPRVMTFLSFPASHYTTIILPSPHHTALNYSMPFLLVTPPLTPLNAFLLDAFSMAEHSINILTPNITSKPAINALFKALARGVNVTVITNRWMMILEQLITAGTITEVCVWKMARRYREMFARSQIRDTVAREDDRSLEEGRPPPSQIGKLKIQYYHPLRDSSSSSIEPVKSHAKCTVIDGEKIVLGSGNMDRASWYTSQELGVVLVGREIVRQVWGMLEEEMSSRLELYFS